MLLHHNDQQLNTTSLIYLSDIHWRTLRKNMCGCDVVISGCSLLPTDCSLRHLSPRFPQLPLIALFHLQPSTSHRGTPTIRVKWKTTTVWGKPPKHLYSEVLQVGSLSQSYDFVTLNMEAQTIFVYTLIEWRKPLNNVILEIRK